MVTSLPQTMHSSKSSLCTKITWGLLKVIWCLGHTSGDSEAVNLAVVQALIIFKSPHMLNNIQGWEPLNQPNQDNPIAIAGDCFRNGHETQHWPMKHERKYFGAPLGNSS